MLQSASTNKGFILIELLVVMGIIVILSGIVLINYRSGQEQLTLQRAASKLAQDIRRVQEMAMSAQEFGGSVPLGGYGIFFDQGATGSYIIYADTGDETRDPGGGEDIETISLEEGVVINSVAPPSASINFKPPDPAITITGGSDATITLSLESDPSKTKTININKVGRVEIN